MVFEKFDVCIVGAGAAGITLAMALSKRGRRVALMEGGGREFSNSSQSLYRGEVEGDQYFSLEACRLRYFGGSTNCWTGISRPLERYDFLRSDLGPGVSGWPIDRSDLDPFLDQACAILDMPNSFGEYRVSEFIVEKQYQISPPTRFLEKYYDLLLEDENVEVFLEADLVNWYGGQEITAIGFIRKDVELNIRADRFVLAMGGLECTRHLLHQDAKNPGLFFSRNMPVGHYFMEHPHFKIGFMTNFDAESAIAELAGGVRYFSLNEEVQDYLNLLGCSVRVESYADFGKADLACRVSGLFGVRESLYSHFPNMDCDHRIYLMPEEFPDATKFIALSGSSSDRYGIPKIKLHYAKTMKDKKNYVQALKYFSSFALSKYSAVVELDDVVFDDRAYGPAFPDNFLGSNHHYGGTKMGLDPRSSVCDTNLLVHGSDNLYVCGSSCFPTSGDVNPTLSIVQMALRLANHLS